MFNGELLYWIKGRNHSGWSIQQPPQNFEDIALFPQLFEDIALFQHLIVIT